MKKLLITILVVGVLTCVCSFFFAYGSSCFLQILLMLLGLAFLVLVIASILAIPALWHKYRAKAFVPILFTLTFLLLGFFAVVLGIVWRRSHFRRHLPEYQEAVRSMETGQIPVDSKLAVVELPSDYHHLAQVVLAERDPNGVVTAEFIYGTFWPPHHLAFLYRGDGDPERWSHWSRWRSYRRIEQNWYLVGD
jgi:hypothetical protein